ncbi:MAG: acetylxylan esterase [Clostridia bacterium]|nr:acetylxylan esterase [Clostridia bacterium]
MSKNKIKILATVLTVLAILSMLAVSVFSLEKMTDLTAINLDDSSIKKVYFKLETNKKLTSYEVNEEIIFTATLWADCDGDGNKENDIQITSPYFQYTMEFDDGTAKKNEYAKPENGVLTLKTKLTKPGAIRVGLYVSDEKRDRIKHSKIESQYLGGAIAGASDINVTTVEPENFDTFWKGQLAQLDAVAPEIEYIADISDKLNKPGFKCYEIRIKCVESNVKTLSETSYVSVLLSLPENAKTGSLQLDVQFEGYGVYDPVVPSPWSSGYNAVMMVYAHSLPLDNEKGWYVNHFQETYHTYDHNGSKTKGYGWDYENDIEDNNNPETVYFRDMFLRDLQAIRFMFKAFSEEGVINTVNDIDTSAWKGLWNGKKLQVSGGSQGGFRSIAAAALNSLSGDNSVGITNLRVSVPWFADIADSTAVGNIKSDFHPEYKDGLAYYDPALLAKRIEVDDVLIAAGTGDGKCPMSGVQAIYNNLNGNATLNFIQGKGHNASYADVVGSSDSSQSKGNIILSGTVTASGPSDWVFDPATGILTISNELKSGWVRVTPCTAAGAWGATIRDQVKHVVIKGHFSKIDPDAFSGYPLLETITLPRMNVQFDNNSFAKCPKLTEIKIEGDAYIPGAVDLSRQTNSETDGHPVNTLADKNAFSGSTSIKAIILNNFYKDEEWYRLKKETLPVNLKTIMGPVGSEYLRAFCEKNGYEFVPFGKASTPNAAWTYDEETKTVTFIGQGAIEGINAADVSYLSTAETLVLSASITELGANAFTNLTGLKNVIIKGNAPFVPSGAKPFGENNVVINVYKNATGFGKTWCGYKVSTIMYIPGDVNCDEKIDIKDAVLLAQYLAKWDVTVDDYSADCNGDGEINVKDAVLLAQYLAKWDVTLGGNTPPTIDPDPDPDPDPEQNSATGEDNEVEVEDFFTQIAISELKDYVISGYLYNENDVWRLSKFATNFEKATSYNLPVVANEELSEYEGHYIFLEDTNTDFTNYNIKVKNGNIILSANYYTLDACINSFFSEFLGYDIKNEKITEVKAFIPAVIKNYNVEKTEIYSRDKLMSVLEELYNDDSRIIIGQQMNQTVAIGEVFDKEVNAFIEGCGVEAALYGWDAVGTMIYPKNERNIESGRVKIAYQMIEYMRDGGIITLSTHFPNPTEENPTPGASIKHLFPNGDSDWQDLFTEGTDTYNRYWGYVKQLGDFIQIFKDNGAPIILRPFLEMNGSWCWYSMLYKDSDGVTKRYPAEYLKKLWIDMYEYFVDERGLDNIIWEYSPNVAKRANPGEYWICPVTYVYPGDEYCDIVAVDWYPNADAQANPVDLINAYEDLTALSGKIFVYGELSAGDNRTVGENYTFTATDYGNMLKSFAEKGVKSAYTLAWSSWDTDEGRVKLTVYEMGNGKEFYAENPGFLDKAATRELLYG